MQKDVRASPLRSFAFLQNSERDILANVVQWISNKVQSNEDKKMKNEE